MAALTESDWLLPLVTRVGLDLLDKLSVLAIALRSFLLSIRDGGGRRR